MSQQFEATVELEISTAKWGEALQEARKVARLASSSDDMYGVDLDDAEVTKLIRVGVDE